MILPDHKILRVITTMAIASDIISFSWCEVFRYDQQIEQDLVICRSLIEIFKDPYLLKHLAFRGGTAIHKFYLTSHARYSEDIDLDHAELTS